MTLMYIEKSNTEEAIIVSLYYMEGPEISEMHECNHGPGDTSKEKSYTYTLQSLAFVPCALMKFRSDNSFLYMSGNLEWSTL